MTVETTSPISVGLKMSLPLTRRELIVDHSQCSTADRSSWYELRIVDMEQILLEVHIRSERESNERTNERDASERTGLMRGQRSSVDLVSIR